MFNIEKMIRNSDFTDLINSTKEERELFGGNQLIYTKLADYKCIHIVKQVILHIFSGDDKILNQLKNDCPEESERNDEHLFHQISEDNISLP